MTDWKVFDSGDLEELTDAVTYYANFLKKRIIPSREVQVFPTINPG